MTVYTQSSTLAFMKPDTDVEQAKRGDAEAFGRLYELYVGEVYRYLYHRVDRLEDAEDLTSQVFLKAWQSIGKYRSQGVPFTAWLLRIAHNTVVDYYRSKKREISLTKLESDAGALDSTQRLEEEVERLQLRRAILRLREDYQRVIVLRFIMGMNGAEVAAIMGKREGTIRVMQHRALSALRSILGEGEC